MLLAAQAELNRAGCVTALATRRKSGSSRRRSSMRRNKEHGRESGEAGWPAPPSGQLGDEIDQRAELDPVGPSGVACPALIVGDRLDDQRREVVHMDRRIQ